MSDQFPTGKDLSDPLDRAKAYFDITFADHGFFRAVRLGFYEVGRGMFRSAQPAPYQIKRIHKNYGIRTVINLRGKRDDGSYHLEVEACNQLGITLVNFPIDSRDAPQKDRLLRAKDLLETIQYPALMHCKSGADRAGFMSVYYQFVHEGRPLEEAMSQLSLRYGHVKQAKTGVLDFFYETYQAYNAAHPIGFIEWVENVYDPEQVKEAFMSNQTANLLVDRLLRRE